MKLKNYKYGTYTCKTYYKKVGQGYEVGFCYGDKTIFVGNFLYSKEAGDWYTTMNQYITKFAKTYTVGYKYPFAEFCGFIKSYLYKEYYSYLDKLFTDYNRYYKKEYIQFNNNYKKSRKNYSTSERKPYLKVA